MRILIDTNVLVRLAHLRDPQQAVSDGALNVLRRQQRALRLVPQVLYEFWAVASRPIERNGLALPIGAINNLINAWQDLFPVLRDERSIMDIWQRLAFQHQVLGKQTHDTRLVAAMLKHGLTHLLTFNGADFRRYSEIVVLDPAAVVAVP